MTRSEEYALLQKKPIDWHDGEDGLPKLRDPARREWVRLAEWTRHVLVGLDREEDLGQLRARLDEQGGLTPRLDARLRRFLQSLARVGYLEIHVPMPERIGRFDIVRELGRGGVGIAYLATDAREGREVVVKSAWGFLNPIERADAALAREARLLARLDHPNVVRAIELVVEGGAHHLARELVEGESLSDRFGGRPPADASASLRIARQAADALAHVHESGLLLVDQKPGNWYVEEGTGRLVLLDVGHAAEQDANGRAQTRRGTPGFMPPEVLQQGRTDTQSDVWGLGRLVAFVRTGRLFRGLDVTLDEVVVGLSPAEARAVRTLCAHEPSARPKDARAARALIERMA